MKNKAGVSILNSDIKRRDEIIFGKYEPETYTGGVKEFGNLTKSNLLQLVEEKFIDLESKHNEMPHTVLVMRFVEKYPKVILSGYVVSNHRKDYRVSITGCLTNDKEYLQDVEFVRDFANLFRSADIFILTSSTAHCWFD